MEADGFIGTGPLACLSLFPVAEVDKVSWDWEMRMDCIFSLVPKNELSGKCDEKEFALWLEMKDGFSWLGKRARTS